MSPPLRSNSSRAKLVTPVFPQKPQLTAFLRWIRLMNSSFCAHQQGHLNGDNAPHPIDLHWHTPAALLLLALRSPQRRRP